MSKLSIKKSNECSSLKQNALDILIKETTKRVCVDLPESVYKDFKKKCIDEDISMGAKIKKLIKDILR